MAKCVVLGASGFIGSVLTRRLLAENHEVHVVDIVEPDVDYRKDAWENATERSLVDLRYYDNVERVLRDSEYVFHLAADVGGVGYLAHHDYEPYFNNMYMSMNVLRAAEKVGIQRMFYTSSSCCYPVHLQEDPSKPVTLHEDMIEFGYPDLMYGREKLMTLRLCERAPFDARVGMINSCYGPGLKTEGDRMKFPAAVTLKALKSKKTGDPIEIWGDGTQLRSYIYVDDTVDKIMTIMFSQQYEGAVNVTTEPPVSCNEVADLVMDILDVHVPIVHLPSEPTGPMARDCSNEKWESVYGPDKCPPFEERMRQFVAWMQEVVEV